MSRPKLKVNDVWILEEVIPYEGGRIIGVFYDLEVAKSARPQVKRWYADVGDPDALSSEQKPGYSMFWTISKHPVRSK